MSHFIRLITNENISQDMVVEFAYGVSQYANADLFESDADSSFININMYEIYNGNVLEIILEDNLDDDAFDNIFKHIELENFELESDLHEALDNKFVVIYPGRFQIWHKGHNIVLKNLLQKYENADVFIATSNNTDNDKSPFTFKEKVAMMKLAGVDITRVIKTNQPYSAKEILANYSKENTIVLYIISVKDMTEENPRFKFSKTGLNFKKDGSLAYMQKWQGFEKAKPFSQHSYIGTVKTQNFNILGKSVNSSSQLRALFSTLDNEIQKQFIIELFGQYSEKVHIILKNKL